jgi:2-polyprenyl-3-methyl-5-hydroxy-6-metoxy-1,4-benzoquinol methylase
VVPHLAGDPSPRILVLGCGNSSLPFDLRRDGFSRITSIDLSPSAIKKMRARAQAQVRQGLSGALR